MRRDVLFTSEGLRCKGWLYVPDNLAQGQKAPVIIMAHGFTGVKEMILPDVSERFIAAGFVTLAFDYRYFGDSEGEPRSQVFPLDQVEDIQRHYLDFESTGGGFSSDWPLGIILWREYRCVCRDIR